jgi:hypothetical protein
MTSSLLGWTGKALLPLALLSKPATLYWPDGTAHDAQRLPLRMGKIVGARLYLIYP